MELMRIWVICPHGKVVDLANDFGRAYADRYGTTDIEPTNVNLPQMASIYIDPVLLDIPVHTCTAKLYKPESEEIRYSVTVRLPVRDCLEAIINRVVVKCPKWFWYCWQEL